MDGGGAGGTIKLIGSVVTSSSSTDVDTRGGNGSETGGNGRFIIGANVFGDQPTVTGATPVQTTGILRTNPFLEGAPQTPAIAGLVVGAESYGLTTLSAPGPAYAGVVTAASAAASLAFVR